MLFVLVAGLLLVSIDIWWEVGLIVFLLAVGIVVLTLRAKRRRGLGIACLVCLLAAMSLIVRVEMYQANVRAYAGTCEVQGRICALRCDEQGVVSDITVDNLVINGESRRGKLKAYVDMDADGCRWVYAEAGTVDEKDALPVTIGQTVSLRGEVRTQWLRYYDSAAIHSIVRGGYYTMSSPEDMQRVEAPIRRAADEKVRIALWRTLRRNMSADSAGVAYGMLMGDSAFISDALLTGYRHSGAAHLLAVSGLHVGVLAAALWWLLRRVRCPRLVRTGLLAAVLGVYAWLCGGTPSVLRAAILSVATALVTDLGYHRDPPSLLALCGLVLLCVNPLWLYDVSFLLSFGAYAGIVLLYAPLRSILHRVPGKVGDALALNLSVTLSILPFGIYFFGGVSLLSVPFNLVLVPVMSVAYTVLLVVSLLSMIPTWGILLVGVDQVFTVVGQAACWVGKAGYVACRMMLWQLPLWYAGVALSSPYCLLEPKVRYPLAFEFFVAVLLSTVLLTVL